MAALGPLAAGITGLGAAACGQGGAGGGEGQGAVTRKNVTLRVVARLAQEAGFLTSAQWIAGGAGAAFGGWLGDRLCRRIGLRWGCRWPIVIGSVVSAMLLIGVALHPDAYAAAVMLGLCFFFNQSTEGAYAANAAAVGGRHSGAAYGLLNTGANGMGFVNALLLSGVAAAFGWKAAISLGAVFALLAVVFILLSRADRQMDQAD